VQILHGQYYKWVKVYWWKYEGTDSTNLLVTMQHKSGTALIWRDNSSPCCIYGSAGTLWRMLLCCCANWGAFPFSLSDSCVLYWKESLDPFSPLLPVTFGGLSRHIVSLLNWCLECVCDQTVVGWRHFTEPGVLECVYVKLLISQQQWSGMTGGPLYFACRACSDCLWFPFSATQQTLMHMILAESWGHITFILECP